MLNDAQFFSDVKKIDYAVLDAKEVFGESAPYVVETKLTGKTILFNQHFITNIREALTNDCMAKMSADEEGLFLEWVAFQNGDAYRDIATDVNEVLIALDLWMANEVNCVPNGTINQCFTDTPHTWATCSA